MRKLLWIVLVACLTLTGCGKDKEDEGDGGGESAVLIAPEKAGDYLLTLADMPSGWSQEPEEEDNDSEDDPHILCLTGDDTPKAKENISVDFKADTFGPYLSHSVGVFETVEQAKTEMATYNAAVDQCQTWTETDEDGETTTYTISRLSFDRVGDESFAVRMEVGSAGAGDALYIRKGNVVVLVTYMALTIEGPQDSIFEEMAMKAIAKLE